MLDSLPLEMSEHEIKRDIDVVEKNIDCTQILEILQRLNKETYPPNPTYGMLSDGDSIEGQQITVTKDKDGYVISFKLREEPCAKAEGVFQQLKESGSAHDGSNIFNASGTFVFSDAFELDDPNDEFTIQLAKGSLNGRIVRAATGVVDIRFPGEKLVLEEAVNKIQETVENLFGIERVFSLPNEQKEEEYKKARYLWSHKVATSTVSNDELQKLTRTEVFPGYWTYIEPGRCEKLASKTSYAVFHSTRRMEDLIGIVKNEGVLSRTERLRRGLDIKGVSTSNELEQGGGNSVFTRIIPESDCKELGQGLGRNGWGILFKNSIMDRTDYWCQPSDTCGTTKPEIFNRRLSPEEYFKKIAAKRFTQNNEQVFRYGIALKDIDAFVCGSEEPRQEILKMLKQNGIDEINGVSVDDFVVVTPERIDMVRLANRTN